MGCEMSEHDNTARRYRDKAEELRALIPHTKDENAREILEKLATSYDFLASVQDQLGRVDKAAS
jgi:hypothetical protein